MTAKQTWVDGRVKVLQAALHELGLSASRLAATDLIRERVHWALSQLGISPAAARRDLTDEAVQELAARWPSPSCKRRPAPTSSTPRTTALPLTLVDRCVAGLAEASRIRLYEADDIDHVRVSVSQIAQALSAIGQITATAPNHRHGSRLRAVGPDELPAPVRDQISRAVVADAVEALARLRTPYWLGDTGVHLHALASLLTQAHEMLPEAIADARDQGLTWTEIGQLLGLSAERPQHAATDPISDLLDRDHPHKCR